MYQLKIGLIGAGERGANCYAPYALKYPDEVKFICVAEPQEERRNTFGNAHKIPTENRFSNWDEMLETCDGLDGVIVATQDREHFEPAMAVIKKGIPLLLEKPMAETAEKTEEIVKTAEALQVPVMVCHVLRHTPFFKSIKESIDCGLIGEVKSIHHIENIGYWHFAHSYVRGNWHNTEETTPMIVAKCCHDLDILNFLLNGKKCKRLSSFGSLSYFKKENMPENAGKYCMEGCPHNKSCMYSAYKYMEDRRDRENFRNIILRTDDGNAFLEYLRKSPYSRCVYQCENDAVDHQVVTIEYEDGITASFQASAFTLDIMRQTKIMGTKGEIEGCIENNQYIIRDFNTGNVTEVLVHTPKTLHAGGDECIMESFASAIRNPEEAQKYAAAMSLQGHLMAFAAEKSRVNHGQVIEFK